MQFTTLFAQDKFEVIEVPTQENLSAVYFHDLFSGWIVGNNGVVLKTIDSGNNWELIDLDTQENFHTINFIDDSIGWISGDKTYCTTNRFNTYSIIDRNNVCFLDSLNIWSMRHGYIVIQETQIPKALIEYSNDGGNIWTIMGEGFSGGDYTYTDFFVYDMNTILTVGGETSERYLGFIKYSSDGGESWENVLINPDLCFDQINWACDSCLIAYGSGHTGLYFLGEVWLSHDFGKSWNLVFSCANSGSGEVIGVNYQNSNLISSCFLNENVGWAITIESDFTYDITHHSTNYYRNRNILKTNDGGINWENIHIDTLGTNSQYNIYSLYGISENQAWLVGENGFALKMSTTTSVKIDSIPDTSQNSYVYPNPTNENIFIKIPCTDEDNVNIKLYNIKGQMILEHNCSLNIGENNIDKLNVSNLSNGIYIINLAINRLAWE